MWCNLLHRALNGWPFVPMVSSQTAAVEGHPLPEVGAAPSRSFIERLWPQPRKVTSRRGGNLRTRKIAGLCRQDGLILERNVLDNATLLSALGEVEQMLGKARATQCMHLM
jgi:hypothetical protein